MDQDEELEATRARIRAAFPLCVAFADAMRAEFGPGVTIEYMSEGGRELGKKAPEGNVYIVQPEYIAPPIEKRPAKRGRKR